MENAERKKENMAKLKQKVKLSTLKSPKNIFVIKQSPKASLPFSLSKNQSKNISQTSMEPPMNIHVNNLGESMETESQKKELEIKKAAILETHSYTSFEETFVKNSEENSEKEIIVKTSESMFNEEEKKPATTAAANKQNNNYGSFVLD